MTSPTDPKPIVDLVERLAKIELLTAKRGNSAEALIAEVPNGKTLKSLKPLLDEYLDKPERKVGTSLQTVLSSFEEYVVAYKTNSTAMFVDDTDEDEPLLVAVFDFHDKGDGPAHFGQHRAVYPFPISEEWAAWRAVAGKWLSQEQFASFLEEHLEDVLDPATAADKSMDIVQRFTELDMKLGSQQQLLKLSRELEITATMKVGASVNLSSGSRRITFGEENVANVEVPGAFAIAVPVFTEGTPYPLGIRLRHGTQSQKLVWKIEPHKASKIFRQAVFGACEHVKYATKIVPYWGRPELTRAEVPEDC